MKNTIKKLVAVVLPFVMFAVTAQGAGFALYEYSARGVAMGGATVANEAEPASLATNPSLITELEGTQVQLGGTVVTAHAKATVNGDARSLKKDVWALPNFYATYQWSDQVYFGIGGFSRYGLGGEYKDHRNWTGSTLAYKVELETFSFTPTIAVKLSDEVSVAMGLEAMTIDFKQSSLLSPPLGDASQYRIHGTGISWGGNYSFTYRPQWAEKWAFGAMYRTKVKQNLNGGIDARMNYPARNIYDADAKGAITLPDSVTAGLSFRPTDNWTLEAGIIGTFWSSYDQILIEYKDMEATPTIHNMKNYKDTFRLNFGTEYWFLQNWAVRAGYVFDKSPINRHSMDTLVPVDDRHIGSIGFGYRNDTWSVDIAYAHIFGRNLNGTASTQYNSMPMKYSEGRSDMYSLTVGYKF
ncbi:MAG: outer membrane protein transport protein [Elusimicrobiaceae bacterium]|nr:outer membrane protein transport protein [Elusimicrobiaceae bacterium]